MGPGTEPLEWYVQRVHSQSAVLRGIAVALCERADVAQWMARQEAKYAARLVRQARFLLRSTGERGGRSDAAT